MFHVLVSATSNRALGSDCCAALCHRPQRGLDRSAAEISWEEISQLDMKDVSFGAVASQPEAALFFEGYRFCLLRPLRPPSLTLASKHLAVGRKLRLQDRLGEQQRPPHARARAHIHKLVLIWRKQPLTFSEGG
jgi:hypothetical protein